MTNPLPRAARYSGRRLEDAAVRTTVEVLVFVLRRLCRWLP